MSADLLLRGALLATSAAFLLSACSPPTNRREQINASPAPSSTPRYDQDGHLRFRPLSGRVVGIDDGDTIIVLDADNQTHKIRLQGIDAPEGWSGFWRSFASEPFGFSLQ
jgi:endonuclease YncB( thermonuclease family)